MTTLQSEQRRVRVRLHIDLLMDPGDQTDEEIEAAIAVLEPVLEHSTALEAINTGLEHSSLVASGAILYAEALGIAYAPSSGPAIIDADEIEDAPCP